MNKINLKLSLLILVVCWMFLTLFTISWDLPSKFTPETDGISSQLNLSAKKMMQIETCKYPPLQYLLADAVTKNISEEKLSEIELERKRSQRITTYRLLSAIMGLCTAVFMLLAGYYFLQCPPVYSLGASIFFLLISPVLFYSQSSNMDIPSCFWFVGSIFFAVLARVKHRTDARKHTYFILHLLAGIFIGCAFCTKDQVYALYILPALAFCYWEWKNKKSAWEVIVPCLLWGITFLTTVFLIYYLISFEVFLPHFHWIIGEGSVPYAVVGESFLNRINLIGYSLRDLGMAMDLPLIILSIMFLFTVYKRKERYKKDVLFIYTALFVLLLLLSQFLFFCQVVRYAQVRYFIPAIPFLLLLILYIFKKEMEENKYKKYIARVVFCLFIYQVCIAINFLYILSNSPIAQLKRELETSSIYKTCRINTTMAQIGALYYQDGNGTIEKYKCIRPWGVVLGLEKYGITDIFPDDLSLFILEPQILISDKEYPFFENFSYTLQKKYEIKPKIFFSLYDQTNRGIYFLYSKDESKRNYTKPLPENMFRENILEVQIIKLSYLFSIKNKIPLHKIKTIGNALAPFTPPDRRNYIIHKYMYDVLLDAYNAADRKEDAKKCRDFYSLNKK